MKNNKIKSNFLTAEDVNLSVMAEFSCSWEVLRHSNMQSVKKNWSLLLPPNVYLLVLVDICCSNFIALLLCIFCRSMAHFLLPFPSSFVSFLISWYTANSKFFWLLSFLWGWTRSDFHCSTFLIHFKVKTVYTVWRRNNSSLFRSSYTAYLLFMSVFPLFWCLLMNYKLLNSELF